MPAINQRIRIPEHIMADALRIMFEAKAHAQQKIEETITALKKAGKTDNSPEIQAQLDSLRDKYNLEQAYKKISVYGVFHSGKSPALTTGWQLAILAGVDPAIALRGASPTEIDGNGRNVAHYAAWSGNKDSVRYIRENFPDMMNRLDNENLSIRAYAAWSGNLEVGIDLTSIQPDELKQDFFCAALSGEPKMLKFMLKIYPTTESIQQEIAYAAALSGNLEAIKMILNFPESTFTNKTRHGFTIAQTAARSGNLEALQLVLKSKPNLALIRGATYNIADRAALSGNENMFKWIIDNHAQLLDLNPNFILQCAASSRSIPILHLAFDQFKTKSFSFATKLVNKQENLNELETLKGALETNTTLNEVNFPSHLLKSKQPDIVAAVEAIKTYLQRNRTIQAFEQKYPQRMPMELLQAYCEEPSGISFFNRSILAEKNGLRALLTKESSKEYGLADWIKVLEQVQSPTERVQTMLNYMRATEQLEVSQKARRVMEEEAEAAERAEAEASKQATKAASKRAEEEEEKAAKRAEETNERPHGSIN